ncbi:MAG: sigma-70 family RNA polymerase sigma factor [Candidatus Omnitrophica bacterium]|nr:sigma-70 family RNA polymerase sigma factor [Candidatus Omnitrophota bacterium]
MQKLNNRALLRRCIKSDKAAWDEFVQRFSKLVYWAIRKKLSQIPYHYSQPDIEDIFQNIFVLLWEKGKLRQIKNRDNISAWIVMVAANCVRNYFRNKRDEFVDIGSFDCSSGEKLEQKQLNDILGEALSHLSARERIVLKLNYLHQKTHQEIAAILKMPTNTVSSLVKRAKEKLRQKLAAVGWQNF